MKRLIIIMAFLMAAHPGHAMDQLPETPATLTLIDFDDLGGFEGDNDGAANDQDVQHIVKRPRSSCPEPGGDRTFASKQALQILEQSHKAALEEQKPYPCRKDRCNQTFNQAAHRDRHELTHEGQKPFPCTVQDCKKAFTRDTDRIRHENEVHSGIANHKCSFCAFVTTRMSSIKSHERTHTGEKPYQCRFCKLAFSYSNQCKNHEEKCTKNLLIAINSNAQNNSIDD